MPVSGVYIVVCLDIKLCPAYVESRKVFGIVDSIGRTNKFCFFVLQFQLLILNSLCRGTARREISPIHQWRLARVGFCCCFRAIPTEHKTIRLDVLISKEISPFGA